MTFVSLCERPTRTRRWPSEYRIWGRVPPARVRYSSAVRFLSALAFVASVTVLVLLAGPPGVVVAIIAAVVVGVLLKR